MTDTTRRIREMSVLVDAEIPPDVTIDEYRSSRRRATTQKRGRRWTLRRSIEGDTRRAARVS